MNDKGVKVYEDVVSSEAGGTYSFSLAGRSKWPVSGCVVTSVGHLTGKLYLGIKKLKRFL